ncbi:MAG: hypothetical protein IJY97_06505 [Clostridia bacterium]|nr:hypothetical protein [Clostridia bacterium]
MKRNYYFIVVLVALFALASVSLVLAFVVEDVQEFDHAAAGLIISILFTFQYKYALNPPNSKYGINTVKMYYHKKGALKDYKTLCIIISVISFLLSIERLIRALLSI